MVYVTKHELGFTEASNDTMKGGKGQGGQEVRDYSAIQLCFLKEPLYASFQFEGFLIIRVNDRAGVGRTQPSSLPFPG